MINVTEEIEIAHLKAKSDWGEVVRLRELVVRLGKERDNAVDLCLKYIPLIDGNKDSKWIKRELK